MDGSAIMVPCTSIIPPLPADADELRTIFASSRSITGIAGLTSKCTAKPLGVPHVLDGREPTTPAQHETIEPGLTRWIKRPLKGDVIS